VHGEGWQTPPVQSPEQHAVGLLHGAPVRAQLGGGVPQTGGAPMQLPVVHSKLATHEVPSASGAEAHRERPVPSSAHAAPWQQSRATLQTEPSGRHGPGPGSQRPVESQTPQQVPPPPE
jgi:hypothetical protein